MTTTKPPILATCGSYHDGQMPVRLAGLLSSGMWDGLAPDDRGAFTERGIVYDTPSGEAIFRWLCRVYKVADADRQLELRRATNARKAVQQ